MSSPMRSRAAIVREVGGDWSVEEFELDPPRAGEVLVAMAAAGLCHSDDHIRNGFMAPPTTQSPGRRRSAAMRDRGGARGREAVTGLAPGDHVVTSFVAVCGHCRWCSSGMEYLCDRGAGVLTPGMPTDGTFRHHTVDGEDLGHTSKIGAFAEHTVVAADSLVKIDPDIPLVPAALLSQRGPHRLRLGGPPGERAGGDTVVVVGAGGIGTAAIQGAVINGATVVVAVDPVAAKRESALSFGATHTAADADEAIALVRGLTRGVMADAVVLAPSEINGVDIGAALALTRKGGTCVLTGMAAAGPQPVSLDIQDLVLMNKNLCGTVFGSCNPRRRSHCSPRCTPRVS